MRVEFTLGRVLSLEDPQGQGRILVDSVSVGEPGKPPSKPVYAFKTRNAVWGGGEVQAGQTVLIARVGQAAYVLGALPSFLLSSTDSLNRIEGNKLPEYNSSLNPWTNVWPFEANPLYTAVLFKNDLTSIEAYNPSTLIYRTKSGEYKQNDAYTYALGLYGGTSYISLSGHQGYGKIDIVATEPFNPASGLKDYAKGAFVFKPGKSEINCASLAQEEADLALKTQSSASDASIVLSSSQSSAITLQVNGGVVKAVLSSDGTYSLSANQTITLNALQDVRVTGGQNVEVEGTGVTVKAQTLVLEAQSITLVVGGISMSITPSGITLTGNLTLRGDLVVRGDIKAEGSLSASGCNCNG